jgi:hypothetical protein
MNPEMRVRSSGLKREAEEGCSLCAVLLSCFFIASAPSSFIMLEFSPFLPLASSFLAVFLAGVSVVLVVLVLVVLVEVVVVVVVVVVGTKDKFPENQSQIIVTNRGVLILVYILN